MKLTLSSALLATTLFAPAAFGQNLLTNGSFDDSGGSLAGWGAFGNASAEVSAPPAITPRSAPALCKMFGNFSGGFDVSGIFQSIPANPGQSFTIDCWSRHFSGDPLTGGGSPNSNWVVMKIAFFDAGNNEIAGVEGVILDGTSPTDTWIDNAPVTGTAPVGTATVQALVLFLQPANDGGAAQIDDVTFTTPRRRSTYPGSGEDLVLATGLNGAPPSSGPGADVKQAAGGSVLEINVSSPQSTYDLFPYWVLGQPFTTGNPPTPSIPNVWFDLNQPLFALIGPSLPPFRGPLINPGSGSSSYFLMPAGLQGTSLMLQAVVFSPSASNGLFSISDGHEIQLQ